MDRRTLLRRLAGGPFALLASATWPSDDAAARRVFPVDGTLNYLVLRNDRVIGQREVTVSRATGDFVVRLDEAYLVGPSDVPWFRYEQHCEEIWREGWLHAVTCDTEDDGALWRVRAERSNGVFAGDVNGLDFTVSGYAITSTFWHRDVPTQQALLDVTDARVKLIRATKVGRETLAVGGSKVETQRFALRGEINRDLWYDENCGLAKISKPLSDGSLVVYELA